MRGRYHAPLLLRIEDGEVNIPVPLLSVRLAAGESAVQPHAVSQGDALKVCAGRDPNLPASQGRVKPGLDRVIGGIPRTPVEDGARRIPFDVNDGDDSDGHLPGSCPLVARRVERTCVDGIQTRRRLPSCEDPVSRLGIIGGVIPATGVDPHLHERDASLTIPSRAGYRNLRGLRLVHSRPGREDLNRRQCAVPNYLVRARDHERYLRLRRVLRLERANPVAAPGFQRAGVRAGAGQAYTLPGAFVCDIVLPPVPEIVDPVCRYRFVNPQHTVAVGQVRISEGLFALKRTADERQSSGRVLIALAVGVR